MRVIVILGLWFAIASVQAANIRVASAANFYPTLNKIKQFFEESTGHKVTIIRGSTGKLYAQIMHGAPYELLISRYRNRDEQVVNKVKGNKQTAGGYTLVQM